VRHVNDGLQALDYLYHRGVYAHVDRPDLVLLDLNMPRMGGHDVLTRVKDDADLKAIPVVVLTTSDAATDIVASYSEHANAFVTKPMDLDSFEDVVQKISRFYSETVTLP
jgi:CheY-like chemotaxis protein